MVHKATGRSGTMLFVHNLADQPCRLELGYLHDPVQEPLSLSRTPTTAARWTSMSWR